MWLDANASRVLSRASWGVINLALLKVSKICFGASLSVQYQSSDASTAVAGDAAAFAWVQRMRCTSSSSVELYPDGSTSCDTSHIWAAPAAESGADKDVMYVHELDCDG